MKMVTVNTSVKMYRHVGILLLTLCLLIFASSNALAQVERSEYQVKAAFLYQFANYIEWPPGAFTSETSLLVFGVLGADQLADNLEQITRDRKIQGRTIQVRRLQPGDPAYGLHVLFVGRSVGTTLDPDLFDVASMSVLTVTETTSPRSPGSVINFEIIDDRVKFDVSLQLAELGKLKISSRLLQVAHRVINDTP